MPLKIKIKPIQKWIGPETKMPGTSRFKKTYRDTLQILDYELSKLNVVESSVQIEMFIRPEDLRIDGELRVNAKPTKPGVILSFASLRTVYNKAAQKWERQTKPLSYPCDTFNDWQDNLRAIALSLAKLRDVARYGVFKYEDMVSRLALPSATGKVSNALAAAEFIAEAAGGGYVSAEVLSTKSMFNMIYSKALHVLHPDKPTGSHEKFIELQNARKVLDEHFN